MALGILSTAILDERPEHRPPIYARCGRSGSGFAGSPKAEAFTEECGIAKAAIKNSTEYPGIDILYNPTPNHLHVPLSMQAIEHGKHVRKSHCVNHR